MSTKDFIEQLNKELNITLIIKENKNISNLGNIFYEGVEICACPFIDIYEDVRPEYKTTFPGDREVAHPSTIIIKSKIISFLDRWNNEPDFKETMLDK